MFPGPASSAGRTNDDLEGPAPTGRPSSAEVGTALAAAVRAGWIGDLPLPGSGDSAARFAAFARTCAADVTLGRLVEAHADAVAILAELDDGGATASWAGQEACWGVWAAEHPAATLSAAPTSSAGPEAGPGRVAPDASWRVSGAKAWCSGAPFLTHALVTAAAADGNRLLAVSLAEPGVRVADDAWAFSGMRASGTSTVTFDEVAARPVGPPGAYLERPGFWHGAVGVAACWFGGAVGVARALSGAAGRRELDPHALAHLGAVDAELGAAASLLREAAAQIDADPGDEAGQAQRRALRVRAVVERAADEVLRRVGRALGPGPLVGDLEHARRVEDLTIYLRQSHAERDLATLGGLVAAGEPGWC
ncbi:acyl-CoA dehydrogenase [Pseudofrankia inefficax]|uniref:Acyl-CoA dehydrogenase n=1 Tax=Pseudofrankia inefficax (strain DSM 45817 / CECT 9037 / DDB 130130 / EuI1c) TaxID=298654 RepID=E3J8H9_PSEI1|nr:acyl-CoA dehydrogenase [Pseudofrankia inefficax]